MNDCRTCKVLAEEKTCNDGKCPTLCGCHLEEVLYPGWQPIEKEKTRCGNCEWHEESGLKKPSMCNYLSGDTFTVFTKNSYIADTRCQWKPIELVCAECGGTGEKGLPVKWEMSEYANTWNLVSVSMGLQCATIEKWDEGFRIKFFHNKYPSHKTPRKKFYETFDQAKAAVETALGIGGDTLLAKILSRCDFCRKEIHDCPIYYTLNKCKHFE